MSPPVGIVVRDMGTADVLRIAEAAEEAGFSHLFLPESGAVQRDPVEGRDPFVTAAVALAATSRLHVGPGIAGTVWRPARFMALAAATVHERFPGRFVLGCGVARRDLTDGVGVPFPSSPLAHAAAYCDELLALSRHGLAFGGGFPVYLAARGDKMLSVAARHADGAILTWVTPADCGRIGRLMADAAGAPAQTLAFVRIGHEPTLVADAAAYAGSLPGYTDQFRRQGLDTAEAAAHGAAIPFGSAAAARERLEEYRAAGVRVPCLFPRDLTTGELLAFLDQWRS